MAHVSRTPEVRRDLIEITDFISHDNLDAALRFLDAAEETFHFLQENPQAGAIYRSANEALPTFRVWPIHRYRNFLAFYRLTDDGIEIVRVLHGARDLGSHIDT
jgi:toxin ParE1/3/4